MKDSIIVTRVVLIAKLARATEILHKRYNEYQADSVEKNFRKYKKAAMELNKLTEELINL